MFTYTNFKAMRSDLKESAAMLAQVMFDTTNLNDVFVTRSNQSKMAALKLLIGIPAQYRDVDVEIAPSELSKQIKEYPEEVRIAIWSYRNAVIRSVLLTSIVANNKIRPSKLAAKSLTGIVKEILVSGHNEISISQAVHNIPLTTGLIARDGTPIASDAWTTDEIRLQFISELCELDFLNMRLVNKTQMLSIPDALDELVAPAEWDRLKVIAAIVNKKTILTEPAPVENKGMITTSSWFYETPRLSDSQVKFIETMHNTKFEFVDNAEDLIEAAYMEHLCSDTGILPDNYEKWVPARIEMFKEQIRASHANGGHYIAGRFDSALRWYFMAEIGHFQTSSSLRKLVKVSGISNPVKYDMRNNVVQMYALSLGIKDLGSYVGLVAEAESKEDLRLTIAKRMNTLCEMDVFNKDNIKPIFMTWAYNAGKKLTLDGVITESVDFFGRVSRKTTVEGLLSITGIANTPKNRDTLFGFWDSILTELVPSIVALKLIFNRITKKNPFTLASWTLPDGAVAQYASVWDVKKNAQTLYWVDSTNHRHQHTHYRKELEANAKAAGLLPRVIHSLDAYVARTLVIRAADLGITVVPNHDSFLFDECHIDTIYRLVRELFIEVLDGHYLDAIINQLNPAKTSLVIKDIGGKVVTIDSFGARLTADDIMAGNPMDTEEI